MYLVFALLAAVALVAQPRSIWRVSIHPVLIAGYVLVAFSFVAELLHSSPDLQWCFRMAQMVLGAGIVGSYIRGDRDVDSVLTGYIIATLWVATLIVRSSYGVTASAGVGGFHDVSLLRVEALSGLGLKANWNMLSVLCAAGAGIAAGRAVLSVARERMIYIGVMTIALMATFLTFSRTGMLAATLALGYVFGATLNRKLVLRLMLIAGAVLLFVWLVVPRVVFDRVQITFDYDVSGQQESRAHVYSTLVRTLPSYVVAGVGAGNYWEVWAFRQGLSYGGVAAGAHNMFLQVAAFWGLAGLLPWSAIVYLAWRTLRKATRRRLRYVPLNACLLTILIWMTLSHDLADKQLSIAFGTIVGLSVSQKNRRLDPSKRIALRPTNQDKATAGKTGAVGNGVLCADKSSVERAIRGSRADDTAKILAGVLEAPF